MIPKLHPLQGQVLIGILSRSNQVGKVLLPENRSPEKDLIGREPGARARVLEVGAWLTTKAGRMLPYEFKRGDVVYVDLVKGKEFKDESGRFKIIRASDILAKEC